MKGLFIINPSSGRQNFKDKIKDIIGTLILEQICETVEVYYTEKGNDALVKAASLKAGEYDFTVAVGGDGTLNEVVAGTVMAGSHTPVAVISAGTVNDFASHFKLPQTSPEFCEMIRNFKTERVDAGKVNGQFFINVVAAGMLSDTGFKVEKDKKAVFGKLAYYAEGALDMPKQFSRPFHAVLRSEDRVIDEEILLFIISNSRSVGGFRNIAPLADVTDGLFDVIVVKKMDLLAVGPLLVELLAGKHINHPSIEYFQAGNLTVEIPEGDDIAVDYDGEKLDDGFPIHVEMIPRALDIVVP